MGSSIDDCSIQHDNRGGTCIVQYIAFAYVRLIPDLSGDFWSETDHIIVGHILWQDQIQSFVAYIHSLSTRSFKAVEVKFMRISLTSFAGIYIPISPTVNKSQHSLIQQVALSKATINHRPYDT